MLFALPSSALNLAPYALQAPENARLYPDRIKPLHAHMPVGIHADGPRRIPGRRHTVRANGLLRSAARFPRQRPYQLRAPNNDLDAELSKGKTSDLDKAVAAIRVGKRIQPVPFTAPFHHKGCERGGFSSGFWIPAFAGMTDGAGRNDGWGGNGRSRGNDGSSAPRHALAPMAFLGPSFPHHLPPPSFPRKRESISIDPVGGLACSCGPPPGLPPGRGEECKWFPPVCGGECKWSPPGGRGASTAAMTCSIAETPAPPSASARLRRLPRGRRGRRAHHPRACPARRPSGRRSRPTPRRNRPRS